MHVLIVYQDLDELEAWSTQYAQTNSKYKRCLDKNQDLASVAVPYYLDKLKWGQLLGSQEPPKPEVGELACGVLSPCSDCVHCHNFGSL